MLRLLIVGFLSSMVATGVFADPLPSGFERGPFTLADAVSSAGGVVTFHVAEGKCSPRKYGDSRGESDCTEGGARSSINRTAWEKLGTTTRYEFDVQIDPSFAYAGWMNPAATYFHAGGWDSQVRIASWEGRDIHNFIYLLAVDGRRGISFLNRTCQKPEQFGQWVHFALSTHWADDDTGWVKVTCDDRLIYEAENTPTNQSPNCWGTNECDVGVYKDPQEIMYILGPVANGFGHDWKRNGAPSHFLPLGPSGITVRMRNIAQRANPPLYDRADVEIVKQLQSELAKLGCDPGGTDGVVTQQTRDAVFSCRAIPFAQRPAQLDVTTAPVFAKLYSDPAIAALGPGQAPAHPDVSVREVYNQSGPGGPDASSYFAGSFREADGTRHPLNFEIVGTGAAAGGYSTLALELTDFFYSRPPPKAVGACSPTAIRMSDDGPHVVLPLDHAGRSYVLSATGRCVLKTLSGSSAREAHYLLDHFADIAKSMLAEHTIDTIQNEPLRAFIVSMSRGVDTIGAGKG